MKIIGIIPARMSSSRFPGKPMAEILGIPMIGHVYFRCKMAESLDEVYVATCDKEIYDYIESIGGKAVMTSDKHERASDRTAEAVLEIEKEHGKKMQIIVMIQGDEPMVFPEMIDSAIEPMKKDPEIKITNLLGNLKNSEEFEDPNEVKVVVDKENFALYFSREPIPSRKKGVKNVPMYKQVCIIPFERDFLMEYNKTEQTELEKIESVDMLRILENGGKIKMVPCSQDTYSVDTEEDRKKVEELMKNDPLVKKYKNK